MLLPLDSGGRSEEKLLTQKGSGTRLPEEKLLAVIEGFDPETRRRLRQLAEGLRLDEVSAVAWLNEKTAGTHPRGLGCVPSMS